MTEAEKLEMAVADLIEIREWARRGLTGYPTFCFQSLNAIRDNVESALEHLEVTA